MSIQSVFSAKILSLSLQHMSAGACSAYAVKFVTFVWLYILALFVYSLVKNYLNFLTCSVLKTVCVTLESSKLTVIYSHGPSDGEIVRVSLLWCVLFA